MKLTCPGCSANYTLSAERMQGRRVKVRCKRCGEGFLVEPAGAHDAPQVGGEMCAPEPEAHAMVREGPNRRARDADLFAGLATAGGEESLTTSAAPFTGERNESSVLFSLAALANKAPPPAATVTESSALIDIRALCAPTSRGDAPRSRADDIVNLSGGGAFAPLFAPPVTFVPADQPEAARSRKTPIVVASIALAVVAMVGAATFAITRAGASTSEVTTRTASASSVTSVATAMTSAPPSTVASDEAPAPSAPPTSSAAPLVRPAVRVSDARPIASQVAPIPTTSAAPKCCPGESDTACHMRLAVGVACGGEASTTSTNTPLPPFERPAAARALAISVASCKRADGPTGAGHVKVTFQPSGVVSAVDVEAPYSRTATGACIAQRYRGVSVPAFSGGPLTVGKGFAIE